MTNGFVKSAGVLMGSLAAAVVVAVFAATSAEAAWPVAEVNESGYCGMDGVTYSTVEMARKKGGGVMHCGACGACSTYHDIELYKITKENLTAVSRSCAWKSVFSKSKARKCMDEKVGFTSKCMDCWMENILCDRKHCLAVCLESMLKNESYVDEHGNLNKCLQCDEDKCGPAFKKCAGANRRRSCIASDIFRDQSTICKDCDPFPV